MRIKTNSDRIIRIYYWVWRYPVSPVNPVKKRNSYGSYLIALIFSISSALNQGLIVNRNPDVASFKAKVDIAYKEYAKEPWFNAEMIEKIRAIK